MSVESLNAILDGTELETEQGVSGVFDDRHYIDIETPGGFTRSDYLAMTDEILEGDDIQIMTTLDRTLDIVDDSLDAMKYGLKNSYESIVNGEKPETENMILPVVAAGAIVLSPPMYFIEKGGEVARASLETPGHIESRRVYETSDVLPDKLNQISYTEIDGQTYVRLATREGGISPEATKETVEYLESFEA